MAAPNSEIRIGTRSAIARLSVGLSFARRRRHTPTNQQRQGGDRDQGERALSQHRGLQVRHGLLPRKAHAHGAAEARVRLQAHGGGRRHRRRRARGARDLRRHGHLYFDTTDAFQAAFAPHAQAILADIPNYTNTQPTIQISEVKL
jgi:hypothetical protein